MIDYMGEEYWQEMVEGGPIRERRHAKVDKKINFLLRVIFMTDILHYFGKEGYESTVRKLNLEDNERFREYKRQAQVSSRSYKQTEPLQINDGNLLFLIWTEVMLNYCPLLYMKQFFPNSLHEDKTILNVSSFNFYSSDNFDTVVDEPYLPPMLFSSFFDLVKTKKYKFENIKWSFEAQKNALTTMANRRKAIKKENAEVSAQDLLLDEEEMERQEEAEKAEREKLKNEEIIKLATIKIKDLYNNFKTLTKKRAVTQLQPLRKQMDFEFNSLIVVLQGEVESPFFTSTSNDPSTRIEESSLLQAIRKNSDEPGTYQQLFISNNFTDI